MGVIRARKRQNKTKNQDAVSQGRSQEEERCEGKDNLGSEEDGEDKEGLKEGGEDGEEDRKEGEDKETLRSKTKERAKEESGKGRKEKVVGFTEFTSQFKFKE